MKDKIRINNIVVLVGAGEKLKQVPNVDISSKTRQQWTVEKLLIKLIS